MKIIDSNGMNKVEASILPKIQEDTERDETKCVLRAAIIPYQKSKENYNFLVNYFQTEGIVSGLPLKEVCSKTKHKEY